MQTVIMFVSVRLVLLFFFGCGFVEKDQLSRNRSQGAGMGHRARERRRMEKGAWRAREMRLRGGGCVDWKEESFSTRERI